MFFSVIIPLFNKAPYIAKAISSVLSQTFSDYELVIIDDGSKDNSSEIALRAIEGRANCRLLRQHNAGVSKARNNAVSVSNGDYLCFLDGDDWWDSHFLEEMAQLTELFPDAGIYGSNYTIVNETRQKTRIAKVGVGDGFEKGYINYCQAYAQTMYMPLWTGAVSVPRHVFDEMGGFPEHVKLGEDFLLWIHIAMKHKVAFLNKPLAYYNQDVDAENRVVGRLHNPQEHLLWNLTDLEPLEATDMDYKLLVDALRVYDLMPYYLSKEFRKAAMSELKKVDWAKQPQKIKREYKRPIGILKLKYALMKIGSTIKQKLFSYHYGKSNPNQMPLDRRHGS